MNQHKRKSVPHHVRSAWTPEQQRFIEHAYHRHPHGLGPEYVTASRSVETALANESRREFFLSYWPEEALASLERFKRSHYDLPPDSGHYAETSISQRVRKHYPSLLTFYLRPRVAPLQYLAGSHEHARSLYYRFAELDDAYHRKLHAADELIAGLDLGGAQRNKKLHELYRLAFESVYPALKALLKELAEAY